MKKPLSRLVYRAACFLVARFYCPKPAFEGLENLPDGPCVIVGNHAQMYGPIIADLYIPGERAIWCAAEMMRLSEVPAYAYRDFWSKKPRWSRWFYRLLSYAVAPLSVCIFNNAHCIGVYRDGRVMTTMRKSLEYLESGAKVVIFPEHEVPHNPILWDFQRGFVDLARMYAHKTQRALSFVPMYVAPRLKKVVFGKPVACAPRTRDGDPRESVCAALMDAITAMAAAQPRHRVVPYPNVPKRDYPWNRIDEVSEA